MAVHIKSKGNNIHVSCSFSVSEKRSLYSVSSCKQTEFRIGNSAATVVMRVKGNNNIFPLVKLAAHIFNLICVDMRHRKLNGYGQVDNNLVFGSGVPDFQYLVTDFKSILRLCSGKAFGRVFKAEVSGSFCRIFLYKLSAGNRDFGNFRLFLAENLLTLSYRGRIVKVYDCIFSAFESLKGFLDYVLTGLGKNLNLNVAWDKLSFDKGAAELVFRFACCRKAYFNFLEAYSYKGFEEFKLFFKAHRHDKRLISVTQVYAAPKGSLFYIFPLCPFVFSFRRIEIIPSVLSDVFHFSFFPFFPFLICCV